MIKSIKSFYILPFMNSILPSTMTSAFDKGISYAPVGTSSTDDRYKIFGSKNIQGFLSLMQLKRRPFAWIGPRGITI